MRHSSVYVQRRDQPEMQMLTPLIDVVFLLLVFFLWTASFQVAEQVLPSQLSALTGNQGSISEAPLPEADFDEVVVSVAWTGERPSWTLNDAPVESLGELKQRLMRIAEVKRDAPIIVDSEAEVPLGAVIDVYDTARLAGFEQVQFAASEAI